MQALALTIITYYVIWVEVACLHTLWFLIRWTYYIGWDLSEMPDAWKLVRYYLAWPLWVYRWTKQ